MKILKQPFFLAGAIGFLTTLIGLQFVLYRSEKEQKNPLLAPQQEGSCSLAMDNPRGVPKSQWEVLAFCRLPGFLHLKIMADKYNQTFVDLKPNVGSSYGSIRDSRGKAIIVPEQEHYKVEWILTNQSLSLQKFEDISLLESGKIIGEGRVQISHNQ